ncbi:MAG: hypothetical protein ACOYL8_00740 [Patescibacteria group bacterium]
METGEAKKMIKSNFFIAVSEKICQLKKDDLDFSLTKFYYKDDQIELGISGVKEINFILSFEEESVFLDNEEYKKAGGRPTYAAKEMIIYLLVLVNDGEVPGKLALPVLDKELFGHSPVVIPT